MPRFYALVACALLAYVTTGCSRSRPQADIDRGRAAVTAALENWKTNAPPAALKSLPEPVEFSDELRASYKLTDYSITREDGSDPEVIRYTVTLKLLDRRGKATEREAVYSVALKSPIVVARDPYF